MERNRLDSDDAVGGNLNGTEDADLIIAAGELVSAGGGNDVVRVNEGGNTVIGLGAGRDVLRLNEEGAQARVLDFEPGVDRINLRSLGVEDFDDLDIDTLASVNDPAEGTIIRAGGAEIRLLDVDPDELSAENFRFAANDDDDVEEAEAADDDDDERPLTKTMMRLKKQKLLTTMMTTSTSLMARISIQDSSSTLRNWRELAVMI